MQVDLTPHELLSDEAARLQALHDYQVLDTDAEDEFDDFTALAAHICGTPVALISLIDSDRQWFKSRRGMAVRETPRHVAFCDHAIRQEGVFVVPDAPADARFADNPLVTGDTGIQFYAGAPLVTSDGHALGSLCVIDHHPRTLSSEQETALSALSRQVVARLELRRQMAERAKAEEALHVREEALRVSEARKAAILASALDCIITMDAAGRVVEWNPAAEATFGYPASESVGRDLASLIVPPALRESHRRGLAHYLATGEGAVLGRRIEITAVRADGTELPVELAIRAVPLGGETLFTATLRDLSERRAAEQALHEQESQYRLLFENATHGIYRTTPDGRILLANPALLLMLDYDSFEQLAARDLEAGGTEAAYERVDFKAGLEEAGELRGLEAVWKRRDGRAIHVCENARLVRGADGAPLYYEGTVEDITVRKEAEEALRRSEARFQRNAANAPGMMYQFVLHPDGSVEFPFVSDGCRDIYGVEPCAIMGDPLSIIRILHPEDEAGFQASLAESARTLEPWQWEGRFLRASGETRWVQGASRPERQPDGGIVWDGLLMDVTAHRQVQEALRRSHVELETRVEERTAALAESEQRYRTLVDLSPETVLIIQDQCVVYANQAAARLLGAARAEDLLGTSGLGFVHPDFRAAVRGRMFQTGVLGVLQQRWVRRDGRVIDVEAVAGPIEHEGKPARQVLARDVTDRKRAEERVHALNGELTQAYDSTIEGWSRALDYRDHETEGHSRRVTELTLRLARAVGMEEDELVHVRRGALLHDIGKMGIPDRVLLKPGPLDDGEWAIMRRHPTLAHEMLSPVAFLRDALDIPHGHHEKWDGTGYPRGLAGEAIPLAARLFAVVDVWDALRSDRPYRRAWTVARTLDHVRDLSGTHFDPAAVRVFLALIEAPAGEAGDSIRELSLAA